MKNKIKFFVMVVLSSTAFGVAEAADVISVDLPSLPAKVLRHDDRENYPSEYLEKANESYRIFHSGQEIDKETLEKGIRLLVETAKAGDPYSLEELAYIVLRGQYGVSLNIEWAAQTLIYLAEKELTDAWNVLNSLNSEIVGLIEEGKKDEAAQLFLKTWAADH
jgi:hypothetical protein